MELVGKKINFLGDSITEGVGASSSETCYVSVLKKLLGLSEARNYGISGTRFARQTAPSENPRFDLDFCKRVCEMDTDADVVVVFGGTNDFGHGDAPFGDFEDRNTDTFYGACHYLMTTLLERYPDSEIVFITPLHREDEHRDGKPPLSEYVGAIKSVAGHYGIPVLDLYRTSGLCANVSVIKEKYMPDGLHPSDAGAERIARRIAAFLTSL